MESELTKKLLSKVADFYEAHGDEFGQTRKGLYWPILGLVGEVAKGKQKIVDVGSGNGRLLDYLPENISYLGLEPSDALRDRAIKEHVSRVNAELVREARC